MLVKVPLQFFYGNTRHEAIIEMFEGQAELGAECFQGYGFDARLLEDKIGRREDGWQIIHQGS